jgi:hypothetical protein
LVLFIERINPANILLRLNSAAYSAFELHHLIAEEIRNEYQHNVTQQIYVSAGVWTFVKQVKEETLNIVNRSISELPETATGTDLGRAILGHLSRLENSPYDVAGSIIRKEIEDLF